MNMIFIGLLLNNRNISFLCDFEDEFFQSVRDGPNKNIASVFNAKNQVELNTIYRVTTLVYFVFHTKIYR